MSLKTTTRPYTSDRGSPRNSTPAAVIRGQRGVEVVDPQEEPDPARQLVADHRGLHRAVGLGQQDPGGGAGRPDHHPALGPPAVGQRR